MDTVRKNNNGIKNIQNNNGKECRHDGTLLTILEGMAMGERQRTQKNTDD